MGLALVAFDTYARIKVPVGPHRTGASRPLAVALASYLCYSTIACRVTPLD